ncbi:MAG: phage terminase large subunit [Deltaproteobacteria bacterium]|nr:phage terminase large subunit [Deltaproteobacteria bacterium]
MAPSLPIPSIAAVDAELELRRLETFIPKLSPRYSAPKHLAPLLERIEAAVEGQPQRVCCSAPPRHAKSESVLHVPAFALRRKPELVFGYATYADRLSRSKSRRARQLALDAGVSVSVDALNEWRTPEGGGLLATGVGGPLTGHGIDGILFVDDPVKNRVEAESAVYRERLMDWWRDVASTRIEPGGSVFVFATRWHEDDLIGQLVREGFDYINLPALDAEGRALWPERWTADALRTRRREVGEYTWASLYQGQPRPRGGRVFGDVVLCTPKALEEAKAKGWRESFGLDVAYTARTSSDYSVAIHLARVGDTFYVLNVVRVQLPPPALIERCLTLRKAHATARWRWYAAGTEEGIGAFLREKLPLRQLPPKGDKFTRAQPVAAAWAAGKVLVPEGAPWVPAFVDELAAFTGTAGDAHDDQVDALAAAFDELQADVGSFTATVGVPTHVPELRRIRM